MRGEEEEVRKSEHSHGYANRRFIIVHLDVVQVRMQIRSKITLRRKIETNKRFLQACCPIRVCEAFLRRALSHFRFSDNFLNNRALFTFKTGKNKTIKEY